MPHNKAVHQCAPKPANKGIDMQNHHLWVWDQVKLQVEAHIKLIINNLISYYNIFHHSNYPFEVIMDYSKVIAFVHQEVLSDCHKRKYCKSTSASFLHV